MDNTKVVVPDATKLVPNIATFTKTTVSTSFLTKLYRKKIYVLILLVVVGAVFFYYKKKSALKSKLKDFKDLHKEFKPATELTKDLEMKENELVQIKKENDNLTAENNKLQQLVLQSQQTLQAIKNQQMLNQQMAQQRQMAQQAQQMAQNEPVVENLTNENVEYNNLGEDENVQQFNLTNDDMNNINNTLEQ